jgi:hypothetical protein
MSCCLFKGVVGVKSSLLQANKNRYNVGNIAEANTFENAYVNSNRENNR